MEGGTPDYSSLRHIEAYTFERVLECSSPPASPQELITPFSLRLEESTGISVASSRLAAMSTTRKMLDGRPIAQLRKISPRCRHALNKAGGRQWGSDDSKSCQYSGPQPAKLESNQYRI